MVTSGVVTSGVVTSGVVTSGVVVSEVISSGGVVWSSAVVVPSDGLIRTLISQPDANSVVETIKRANSRERNLFLIVYISLFDILQRHIYYNPSCAWCQVENGKKCRRKWGKIGKQYILQKANKKPPVGWLFEKNDF